MKKLRLLSLSLVAGVMVALPAAASAINYGGVGGRPANPQPNNPRSRSIFIYTLKPGQHTNDAVKVQNNTGESQVVTLEAVDSELATGGAFTCKQSADPKIDVGAWIKISENTAVVPPNSSKNVSFTVTVPDSHKVGVGEHDGCITLQAASQTATKSKHAGILLSFRSAIRVVVTIPGKIVKKLTISDVKVSSPAKGEGYVVTPSLRNEGNVSLDTSLRVGLVSLFGTKLKTVNGGTVPILPRSQASNNYKVSQPFWGGWYRAEVTASYNSNPKTGLGAGAKSDQRVETMKSALFFASPKPLAALIELAVIVVIVVAANWIIKNKRHASHVKSHWEDYTVKQKDTLQSLSKDRAVPWKRIAKTNKLKPPYHLEKGQRLKLPPKKKG